MSTTISALSDGVGQATLTNKPRSVFCLWGQCGAPKQLKSLAPHNYPPSLARCLSRSIAWGMAWDKAVLRHLLVLKQGPDGPGLFWEPKP